MPTGRVPHPSLFSSEGWEAGGPRSRWNSLNTPTKDVLPRCLAFDVDLGLAHPHVPKGEASGAGQSHLRNGQILEGTGFSLYINGVMKVGL